MQTGKAETTIPATMKRLCYLQVRALPFRMVAQNTLKIALQARNVLGYSNACGIKVSKRFKPAEIQACAYIDI